MNICIFLVFNILLCVEFRYVICKKDSKEKPEWAKKDIRDYTDADLERLYDQWEEDDEPLEPDELPEHLRPQPKIDLTTLDMTNPENLLKMSKKGRSVMAFVTVTGKPSKDKLETLTALWQSGLMNNHINVERFIIDDNRVIFMFKDGSQAWDAKDFLVKQEHLDNVSIENKVYKGEYSKPKTEL